MRNAFTRPRPVAWLFFLLGFGTCVVLGTWQVQRLQWKEGLIAHIAEANRQAPLTVLPEDKEALAALQFRKVILNGHWISEVEFHLAPRYYRNRFGYWIITPLKLADGRILLINRGWVPGQKKLPDIVPETRVRGAATIVGIVRTGTERGAFTPKNQPDQNVWFGRDVAEMAMHAKLENAVPAMVDAVGAQDTNVLPIPSDGAIRLRNDHLSYVLTWYGIALGILVIFLVYHRRPPHAA